MSKLQKLPFLVRKPAYFVGFTLKSMFWKEIVETFLSNANVFKQVDYKILSELNIGLKTIANLITFIIFLKITIITFSKKIVQPYEPILTQELTGLNLNQI